jgi:hypothetical protein
MPETDFHLFFLCPFAKAAWFLKPWFLRSEVFTQNTNSFASILISLLSFGHPEANLATIATFLWCLWKSGNDQLFGRKKSKPEQIAMNTKALLQDLEVSSLTPNDNAVLLGTSPTPKVRRHHYHMHPCMFPGPPLHRHNQLGINLLSLPPRTTSSSTTMKVHIGFLILVRPRICLQI